MKNNTRKYFLQIVLVFFAVTSVTFALANTGKLSGTVMNADNNRPYGYIRVTLLNSDGKVIAITSTDHKGYFLFREVEEGSYYLRMSQGGVMKDFIDVEVTGNEHTNLGKLWFSFRN